MRHYRLVKKSTHLLIAISAFAVIFNAIIFGAVSYNLIEQPKIAHAACDSNTAPASVTITPNTVDKTATFSFAKRDIDNIIEYTAQIRRAPDPGSSAPVSGPVIAFTGTAQPGVANGFDKSPFTTATLTEGRYVASVSYKNLSNESCVYANSTIQTSSFDFFSESAVSLHGSIELIVDPATVNLKLEDGTDNPDPKTTIKYKINDHQGEIFHLWITNCAGGFDDQFPSGTNIPGDAYPADGSYATSELTITEKNCSAHRIRIKTFTADGTGTLTGTAEVPIIVTGASSDTPGGGGPDDPEDPIITPNEITSFAGFTSAFKMPKQINGAGDLIAVVIRLIGYLLGIFAFIGIVFSGIQYLSSGGDSAKAEKAKKTLLYCVIGIIVATLAMTLQGFMYAFWGGPK